VYEIEGQFFSTRCLSATNLYYPSIRRRRRNSGCNSGCNNRIITVPDVGACIVPELVLEVD
jgi:hypothetical protein